MTTPAGPVTTLRRICEALERGELPSLDDLELFRRAVPRARKGPRLEQALGFPPDWRRKWGRYEALDALAYLVDPSASDRKNARMIHSELLRFASLPISVRRPEDPRHKLLFTDGSAPGFGTIRRWLEERRWF